MKYNTNFQPLFLKNIMKRMAAPFLLVAMLATMMAASVGAVAPAQAGPISGRSPADPAYIPGTEIVGERTLNSKTFANSEGSFTLNAHVGHIHYEDKVTGTLENIDTSVKATLTGWEMQKAGYMVELPKRSDAAVRFSVDTDSINFTPTKINGIPVKIVDGTKTANNQVTYPEIAPNIDLVLSCGYNSFRKETVIKKLPKFIGDYFEIEFSTDKVLSLATTEATKVENIYFRKASVWDSAGNVMGIELALGTGTLIKRIPRKFLDKATYPVKTDTTTSFYAGAGDGCILYQAVSNWDTAHDALAGTHDDPWTPAFYCGSGLYDVVEKDWISRLFLPVDTSGLTSVANISAALLYVYIDTKANDDNDGDDWFNVVGETSQANVADLVVADYDTCGAVNNPTEGATRIDLGSINAPAYNIWTLNATGRGWINKTGTTLIGIREGHDCIDSPIAVAANQYNRVSGALSETAGTGSDPYLSVTYTLPPPPTMDPTLVYLELRPDLDETIIRGNAGIPADATVGIYNGYLLQLWDAGANANEQLSFLICVPDRWDGEHDILIHTTCALSNAGEKANTYQLDLAWEKLTANDDVIPVSFHSGSAPRYTLTDTQYQTYRDWFVIDYDASIGDPIIADDIIAIRLRRGVVGGQYTDLNGGLIILEMSILFPRGDLLGDTGDIITEADMEALATEFGVFNAILADWTLFGHIFLVALLLVLTFWRRDIYLYLIACPVLITFGLRWYDLYHNPAGFTMALAMMATGIYCMILAIVNLIKR